jgi:hypothetical protein
LDIGVCVVRALQASSLGCACVCSNQSVRRKHEREE